MSANPYQQDSDNLSTGQVEDRLSALVPFVRELKADIPESLDPETSDVDVDSLPEPMKHYVGAVAQLIQSHSELVRAGVAIDNHWSPPPNLAM